jgi:hypothetical protein
MSTYDNLDSSNDDNPLLNKDCTCPALKSAEARCKNGNHKEGYQEFEDFRLVLYSKCLVDVTEYMRSIGKINIPELREENSLNRLISANLLSMLLGIPNRIILDGHSHNVILHHIQGYLHDLGYSNMRIWVITRLPIEKIERIRKAEKPTPDISNLIEKLIFSEKTRCFGDSEKYLIQFTRSINEYSYDLTKFVIRRKNYGDQAR